MTDKQIIFNCDVDCIRKNTEECFELDCIKGQESILKQLARKEQECEELKEQLKEMNEVIRTETTRCSLVNILKIELDQLKAELTRANCQIADDEILQCDMREAIEELKAENEELRKSVRKNKDKRKNATEKYLKLKEYTNKNCNPFELDIEKAENDKLKQTLAEIKEIAEKIDDSGGCAYGDYDCNNCSSLEQETVCTYKVKKLILQKISECEVNNG